MVLRRDLPVEARIGFDKALLTQWFKQAHLAIRTDIGGTDHRHQQIFDAIVEVGGDRL